MSGKFPETFQKSQEDSNKFRKVSEISWKLFTLLQPYLLLELVLI